MDRTEKTFISILSSAVRGRETSIDPDLTPEEWHYILNLAGGHDILPLVFEAAYRFPSFQPLGSDCIRTFRESAVSSVVRQITQDNEFLTLLLELQGKGMDPVVMKGIIVRDLYPQGCLRPSVDEDILVLPEDAGSYHHALLGKGFLADTPEAGFSGADEISYHKPDSPSYVELHKHPFAADTEIFADLNHFFDDYDERTIRVQIEDVSVRTLAPTDHLLYLILHAFKHFVHSGIGIRAVCDIGMFAERYAKEIDFARIRNCFGEVHAFDFARAIMRIVQLHLLPDAGFFECINDWAIDKVDAEPLLEDILAGGVHGNVSLERLHSSNITLNAIANDKKPGQTSKQGFISMAFSSVFLPLGKMSSRYPYLKKAPVLLPAAWIQRICGYLKERSTDKKDSASESVRLGLSRVELLKKYGIIR